MRFLNLITLKHCYDFKLDRLGTNSTKDKFLIYTNFIKENNTRHIHFRY